MPRLGNAGATNFWRVSNLTNGTYYWSVQAIDTAFAGSLFAAEGSFTLSRPVISAITNRSTPPNTLAGPIYFTVSDAETSASNLIVTVTSSDTNLMPLANITLSGADTNRTLTLLPVTNRSGVTAITITAVDESGQIANRSFLLTVERFGDIGVNFAGVSGPVAWGDFDNDGDLDLVRDSTIYRNDGKGVFTRVAGPLGNVEGSVAAAWGDFDNDGDLDLLITGPFSSRVYRNDGNGVFTDVEAGLPVPSTWGPAVWGDFDRDGKLDILLSVAPSTSVYRNNGNATFSRIGVGISLALDGSIALGDYNKDGELDILLAGIYGSGVYRNNGNSTFAIIYPTLPALYYASVAWGDFDNDDDLDFAASGSTDSAASGAITRIYRNRGGDVFTNLYPVASQGPIGAWRGTVAWGDYDNDGDLDLLVTGQMTNGSPVTKLYRNDGGRFVDSGLGLPALRNSFAAWGDFDNDGSLDLLLSGRDAFGASVTSQTLSIPCRTPLVCAACLRWATLVNA